MEAQAPDQQTEAARATPDDIVVRPSTDADAPAMIAIYTRYVTHGLAKGVEFEPMQADDIKRRRKNMQKHRLPHLVAELHGAGDRLRLCRALPQAARLSLLRQTFDLCASKIICAPASGANCCRP